MDNTEGMWLDPANLSEITINGTVVPICEQFGRRWYQLVTLLRALEFPEAGLGGLPGKIGSQFCDSGEFLKCKDIWYGTANGLSKYAKDLDIYQYSPTGNPKDKQTARVRQLILYHWLPSFDDGSGTAEQAPENGMEYESNTDAVPPPAETGNERIPPDDIEPVDMPAAKPAGIDMGLFERMYDNLLDRVPYMASCLSIPSNTSMAWKLFAVMAAGYLRGSEPIMRPQNDSDGVWGQEQCLCVSEAIRRSLLFG